MRRLRVIVLMHEDLVPPDDPSALSPEKQAEIQCEWDVVRTLRASGHEVVSLGLYDDLTVLRRAIDEVRPHVAFNLLEEFAGRILYDQNVVSYLELKGVPYTGCSPRGLTIAHDKALAKKIFHFHRIPTPPFAVFPRRNRPGRVRPPARLHYPLIVKSLFADASAGISQASVVRDDDELTRRVELIHRRIGTDAIAEAYVDGREIYAGVLGNARLQVLPPREMVFENMPPGAAKIATERVKWDTDYQERRGIFTQGVDDLPPELLGRIEALSRRAYRRLDLCGYARLDFRVTPAGEVYLIEANPNPNIAEKEDFALSAESAGFTYPRLLDRLMALGLRRARPPE